MSVDAATVKRIGRLARIRIEEDEVPAYQPFSASWNSWLKSMSTASRR
jgi:Asp-tRNA(Asn)/Glu-tRNA(Gln) amidotransferase C subunit